jgi:hypothetical protein
LAEPLEPEKPKEEKPALPEKLGINKLGGFFQPSALIQFWGQYSHEEKAPSKTTFRLRRVELRAKGEIVPKMVSYFVNFDLTKVFSTSTTTTQVPVVGSDATTPGTVSVTQPTVAADRSPLQDAWITYQSEYVDVVTGQFKIPVSLEANQSASKLLFPERSRVVREFGDRRDVGVKLEKKIQDVFYYNVALFNGSPRYGSRCTRSRVCSSGVSPTAPSSTDRAWCATGWKRTCAWSSPISSCRVSTSAAPRGLRTDARRGKALTAPSPTRSSSASSPPSEWAFWTPIPTIYRLAT